MTLPLRQGIDDGFLAPYRVVGIGLNVDHEGWRPNRGKKDKDGNLADDRIYNRKDYDRTLVIDELTDMVAKKVTEFLKGTDRFSKTIIFCVDIDHAERMLNAIVRHNNDLVADNYKYVMQITGDNDEGFACKWLISITKINSLIKFLMRFKQQWWHCVGIVGICKTTLWELRACFYCCVIHLLLV